MKQSVFSMVNKIGLVLLGLMMMSSCSDDTDAISKIYEELNELKKMGEEGLPFPMGIGIYEGRWNSSHSEQDNSQVEICNDSIKFVLPEIDLSRFLVEALLNAYDSEFYDEAYSIIKKDYWKTSETVQQVCYSLYGISNNAMYNGIKDDAVFSYEIYAEEVPCRFDIVTDDCTMVYDMSTRLFTLRILYKECVFTNLVSGWQGRWQPEDSQELVFVATKKIK